MRRSGSGWSNGRRWWWLAPAVLALAACNPTRSGAPAAKEAATAEAAVTATAAATTATAAAAEPRDEPLGKLHIPDVVLTDQRGRRVRLYSDLVKGKAVAVQFVYTRCTTICPPLGAVFQSLQRELGARAGKDVQLVTITLDPDNDTPERLLAWGKQFDAGPGWTLLTGAQRDLDEVLRAMTVFTAAKETHAPIVLLGDDTTGDWVRAYGLSSGAALASALARLAPAAKGGGPAQAAAPDTSAAGALPASTGAAKYFPDVVLLTQDGKPMRLYSDLIKGKTVIMNAFFSTCAGSCPVMAQAFNKIQAHLGARLGKDVRILSISVDPENDTPEKLKKYAARFEARPGWYFLTGEQANVDAALRKLGYFVEDKAAHSPIVIVGNEPTGLWKKAFGLAAVDELIPVIDSVVDDRLPSLGPPSSGAARRADRSGR